MLTRCGASSMPIPLFDFPNRLLKRLATVLTAELLN